MAGRKSSGRRAVPMLSAHLLEEELDYELRIRELDSASAATREEKEALLEEHGELPPFPETLDGLDPAYELELVSMKVAEIKAVVAEIESGMKNGAEPKESRRLNTVYVHTLFRVRRMMFRCHPVYYASFRKLVSKLNAIWYRLQKMYTTLAFPKICTSSDDDSEEEQNQHEERKKLKQRKKEEEEERRRRDEDDRRRREKEQKERKHSYRSHRQYQSDSSTSSSSSSSSSDGHRKKKKSRNKGRNVVTSWDFKYNGSSERDLHSFLEDVEDAADTNNVSDDELLRGIGALLTDSARTWHRNRKKKLSSWSVFKKEICSAFAPADNDDEVMDKINNIKQKSDETFAVYEARVSELFRRLSAPLSEKEKLKKVYNGLHLFYSGRFRSSDFNSLRSLRKECESVEVDKHMIQKKEKEERKKEQRKFEKEERRDTRKPLKVAATKVELSNESDESVEVADVKVPGQNALVCWRCGRVGHLSSSCTSKIFCVGCGAKGVIAERCETCARANLQGKWSGPSQPQGNASGGVMWGTLPPFSVPPPNYKQPATSSKNPGRKD